jgi:chromosome segregation ATPase
LSKLEVKLEKKIKDGLKSDMTLLDKEINKFKNADSDKQKRLSDLEKKIGEKNGGNTEEKMNGILRNLDSKLKSSTVLFEGKLSELKKTGIAGKEKMSKLEDSIKKINEYYQKLDSEEQELKKQITRINSSLRAFYSNAILSTDESSRGRK